MAIEIRKSPGNPSVILKNAPDRLVNMGERVGGVEANDDGTRLRVTDEAKAFAVSCYLRMLRDKGSFEPVSKGERSSVDTTKDLSVIAPAEVKQTVKAYLQADRATGRSSRDVRSDKEKFVEILGSLSNVKASAAPSDALKKWNAIEEAGEFGMGKFRDWNRVAQFITDGKEKHGAGASVPTS